MKRIPKLLVPVLVSAAAFGQGLDFSGRSGLPAGIDMSGAYYPLPGQDSGLITASGSLVEYGGIPMNESTAIALRRWQALRRVPTRKEMRIRAADRRHRHLERARAIFAATRRWNCPGA